MKDNNQVVYNLLGGNGGGAILIASSGRIELQGLINADGESGSGVALGGNNYFAGSGSGGAVRLIASSVVGFGHISCKSKYFGSLPDGGGLGRIRIDSPDNQFSGKIEGVFTRGFQPIILAPANSTAHLAIASIAGIPVSGSPSSSSLAPEVIIPAQVSNPVPIVVQCFNIPLNTSINVGANVPVGQVVRGSALNASGSLAQSSATILMNLPRGSGTLMAQTRIAAGSVQQAEVGGTDRSVIPPFSQAGLTTDGERIVEVEIETDAAGVSRQIYITESGKRIPAPTTK